MSEEIDGYQEDLERHISILRDGLQKLEKAKEDRRRNIIAGLEGTLADAKAAYGSFNAAYRELDKGLQPKYTPIGQQHNKDLKELTEALKAQKTAQERKELGFKDDQKTTDEILEEAAKIQKESKASTERSKGILKEITETGTATLEQLQQDRAKLENIDSDLQEMDSDLKLAQNQLKSIARKLTKDKIIRGLCIILCMGILAVVIYLIVKPSKARGSPDSV